MVLSSVETWWNVEHKYGETCIWQVCHRWWYWLSHRHRIERFSKITIILAQSEWSIAKDVGPFSRRCNARHRQTFYDLVIVDIFDSGSICFPWERITQTICIPFKKREKSHFEADVRDIWKVDIGTIRWDFRSVLKSVGKNFWKQLSLINDEDVISLSHAKAFVFSDCVMSWKGESEPNIKYCLGTAVGLVQRFITMQNFGHNWRITDGIRVEYFQRIHFFAARPRSPKVHEENVQSRSIPRTTLFHVDVQWHHMESWRLWKELIANSTLVFSCAERFPAGQTSFFGLGSDTKWYFSFTAKDHNENGTKSLNWWWSNSEKANTQFSELRVRCFEEHWKAKRGGKLSVHFCAAGDTIGTVFRTIISINQFSIYGQVSN